ncbi:MAG TPA: GDSL-type esterase/lipase family protein [Candidatus Sulfotelmatobacter sp.]|nr:GDSL-type esterase/lipase family protein [Candidatus Sulfotelmatobacter sp.]
MRVAVRILVTGTLVIGLAFMIKRHSADINMSQAGKVTHIVLIGASIGQSWQLAEWPARVKASGFSAESVPAWQFDKSEVVEEILMRPARKFHPTRTYLKSLFQAPPRKPEIVILKECSSYFPGDLLTYQRSVEGWVSRLEAKRIKVILATVVPVTRSRAAQDRGKQETLLKYNEWAREFASQHGLKVLDLESALRSDDSGKYLREEFAASDGSHLNSAAYSVLDETLRSALCETQTPVIPASPASMVTH